LKVLLEKAIQSRRFSQHCQIFALFLLRSFALLITPDGKNHSGQSPLLPIKEENHYVEQEIKDFQGIVKSLQNEIITYYPITKID